MIAGELPTAGTPRSISQAIPTGLSSGNPGVYIAGGCLDFLSVPVHDPEFQSMGFTWQPADYTDVDMVSFQLDRGDLLFVQFPFISPLIWDTENPDEVDEALDWWERGVLGLRLFDSTGREVARNAPCPYTGSYSFGYVAAESGTYYLGISTTSNALYNPLDPTIGEPQAYGVGNAGTPLNPIYCFVPLNVQIDWPYQVAIVVDGASPDIAIEDATTSDPAFQDFVVTYTVANNSLPGLPLNFYLSSDAVLDEGDQPQGLGTAYSLDDPLTVGSHTVLVSASSPMRQAIKAGQGRFILIAANKNRDFAESDYSNNETFVVPLIANGWKIGRNGDWREHLSEVDSNVASGPYSGPILPLDTYAFKSLLNLEELGIWPDQGRFRYTSPGDPLVELGDRLVQSSLREPTQNLVTLITADLRRVPGYWGPEPFSINDAWDITGPHGVYSLHKEARALDLDYESEELAHLTRLAGLAWLAGFDYVYVEGGTHVHVSKRAAPLEVQKTLVVNGGSAQRSNIESITLAFNQNANLQSLISSGQISQAVTLLGAAPIPLNSGRFRYDPMTFVLTVDLTVDGFGPDQRTMLPDGRYQLRLATDLIMLNNNPTNHLLDDDGGADGVRRFAFHRLWGDLDGNALVDGGDRAILSRRIGFRRGQPGYDFACDLNGDGVIGITDYMILVGLWMSGRRV